MWYNTRAAKLLGVQYPIHTLTPAEPVRLNEELRQAAIAREKWELIFGWGGQIAPLLRHTKAADLMTALVEETIAYFEQCKNQLV
jgi:hypothetical protein